MITGARLVDGSREMHIYPRDGIAPQNLEVGFPEIREVSDPRTDDDGDRDSTLLHGPRAVSLEMVFYRDPLTIAELLAELKTYLHPRSRPFLHIADDEWSTERRMRLRVTQLGEPYDGYAASQRRKIQAQWKAPDGVWEEADATSVMVNADTSSETGVSFPITFPISWAPTLSTGAYELGNPGGTPSHFVARLYGPCAAPSLRNETTNEEITFTPELELSAGEYVEVDTRERTAQLLSDPAASRLAQIDFEVTSWWRIEPGDQQIRYTPAEADAGSAAVIEYRPSWL